MERSANQHHGNKCRNCGILSCQDQRFENWWPGLLAWIQSNILLVNMVSTVQPAQPTPMTWLKTKGSLQTPCHKPSPKSPFCNFCRFDFNHPQMVVVYGVGDGLYHPLFLLIISNYYNPSSIIIILTMVTHLSLFFLSFFLGGVLFFFFFLSYHIATVKENGFTTALGFTSPRNHGAFPPIPARSAPTPAPRGMPPGRHSEPGCQTSVILGADGPIRKHPKTMEWGPLKDPKTI